MDFYSIYLIKKSLYFFLDLEKYLYYIVHSIFCNISLHCYLNNCLYIHIYPNLCFLNIIIIIRLIRAYHFRLFFIDFHRFFHFYRLIYNEQDALMLYFFMVRAHYYKYSCDIHTIKYKNELSQIIYKTQLFHSLIYSHLHFDL